MLSQKSNQRLYSYEYYTGVKKLVDYLLNHPQYLCCKKVVDINDPSTLLRFKKLNLESEDDRNVKSVSFVNSTYLEDDVLFHKDDKVFSFNITKMVKQPHIDFEINHGFISPKEVNHYMTYIAPTSVTIVTEAGVSPLYFEQMLDLCEQNYFDEIMYCVHNRIPIALA
jgi:hypothetical protein